MKVLLAVIVGAVVGLWLGGVLAVWADRLATALVIRGRR